MMRRLKHSSKIRIPAKYYQNSPSISPENFLLFPIRKQAFMAISSKQKYKRIGLFLGPGAFLLVFLLPGFPTEKVQAMASIVSWMFVWWIFEVIPLGATGLIPLVLYPLFGILSTKETAASYINSTIFLFVGGFLIAQAMEKTELHKRIALKILSWFSGTFPKLLFGFMFGSYFLSMWISNTATTLMMLPIILSVTALLPEGKNKHAVYLLLGIAYAASIGGIATLVGTAPNLSFQRIFSILFPDAPEISFGQWFLVGLPISLSMLVLTWLLLVFFLRIEAKKLDVSLEIDSKLPPMRFGEKAVLIIFVLTALLWLFRKDLVLGEFVVPGWSRLFTYAKYIDDGTVAIAMSLLLFLIPLDKTKEETIATRKSLRDLPWNLLLLFGGGFALASGFTASGLDKFLGEKFEFIGDFPAWLIILTICLGVTFMTELTSNTATTEMLLPILASVAVSIGVNPLLLMLPATISASYAFMMPISTPPNAIVFGSGKIQMTDMMKVGFWINLVGAFVLTLWIYYYASYVFGIDFGELPVWVK